jgi:hypothetical protein
MRSSFLCLGDNSAPVILRAGPMVSWPSGTLRGIFGNCPYPARLVVPYEDMPAAIPRSVLRLRNGCSSGGSRALP